ncbi:hypothetical protein J1605_007351 [Eschrichtius robustus]|uniref:NADPH oxidase 1 n=1 Tax=Eschrichtius robustus TaxID=9764 RepID=A0AB34H0Z7_ESCRO|nr:hypothetical protein J1605_007351 [Eschrichtius robustus]
MKQLMVSSLLCSSRHWPGPEPLLATGILTACSKILLPVCRNLLRTLGKQLDHNLTFHKLVAYIICLHTALHITTHLFNFERYSRSRQATDGSLASILSNLSHQEKDSWLNPIQSSNTTMEYVTFTYTAGVTGVIITIALVLMVTLAMEFIQRSYSEVFWYTHHIFIMYLIGLGIHGLGGLVRDQTEKNMDENHPHKCAEFLEKWNDPDSHCKPPQFEGLPAEIGQLHFPILEKWPYVGDILWGPVAHSPLITRAICCMGATYVSCMGSSVVMRLTTVGILSWKWILTPVIIYIFERILRFYRSQQKVVITKWHPFTLTSAPEEDFFSIHIRTVGDWTENLIRAFEQQNSPVPRIKVNGPFGTVSEDVFQYEVAVLVRAGIGVTPFASILKSIWYKFQNADHNLKTQTIYFYWIYRETGAFAWFSDLLVSLEQEMEELGKVGFLNYRLFLTGWDCNFAGHAALSFDKATDILTGLKQKTSFGRPMWDNEFSTIATAHPKSAVGVFLCGPQTLAKSLRKCCHQYSSLDPRKVQFYFNNGNF